MGDSLLGVLARPSAILGARPNPFVKRRHGVLALVLLMRKASAPLRLRAHTTEDVGSNPTGRIAIVWEGEAIGLALPGKRTM